jgi:hypothetical protein
MLRTEKPKEKELAVTKKSSKGPLFGDTWNKISSLPDNFGSKPTVFQQIWHQN